MKRKMGSYLINIAPDLATKTFSSMSDQNRISTMLLEEKEHTILLLERLIVLLADAIDLGSPDKLVEQVKELARSRAARGILLPFALERIRGVRKLILESCKSFADGFIEHLDGWHEFYEMQLRIYEYVDIILDTYEKAYYTTEIEREPIQDNAILVAQQRLTEVAEQELVQLVLQSNDIAVIMIDRELRVIEVNYSFAELMKVQRETILGQDIDEIFRPRDDQRFVQWVIERGHSGHYVTEYHGEWLTVSTSPIYHDGQLWGAIAVMRNITENKKYEAELTRRESLAAVGQLAAGMAHEIRNPLTSIKGFIQLLREQFVSEKAETYFSVVLTEIERIDGLLNDVLVLARYRDDKMTAERFPLMEEVYGVIRLLEPESIRRGIRLELNDAAGGLYVHGHRARIKQAILNILKNSLEALATKGSVIQVNTFSSINEVVITVEDDGPGLSHEVKMNLFVPFYTTKSEGTGLGLSTTQRIVMDHGGAIFADNSTALGGARFEVRLPISFT